MDGTDASFSDEDEPDHHLLPPEDRVWRHPSEVTGGYAFSARRLPLPRVALGAVTAGALVVVVVLVSTGLRQGQISETKPSRIEQTLVQGIEITAPAVVTTTVAPAASAVTAAPTTSIPAITTIASFFAAPLASVATAADESVELFVPGGRYGVIVSDPRTAGETLSVTWPGGAQTNAVVVASAPRSRLVVVDLGTADHTPTPTVTSITAGADVEVDGQTHRLVSTHNQQIRDGRPWEHAMLLDSAAAIGSMVMTANDAVGLVVDRLGNRAVVLPLRLVAAIADRLVDGDNGDVSWLGIATPVHGAAVVSDITADGPAARLGLQIGDVITAVNGHVVSSADDLIDALWSSPSSAEATIVIERDGQPHSLVGPLAPLPSDA